MRLARKLALAATPLVLAGCASMSNTDKGVLGGAGIGGVTGGVIGNALGNTGAGAVIGAAVGGVSGGLVGNAIDESEAKQKARLAAAPAPRGPLGLTDVAQMAQQNVSDDIIIGQIRTTGSVYQLSSNDIVWLKQNNVSDTVVREMQRSVVRPVRAVYGPPPPCVVPVYEPVYMYEPPPPRVHLGVGYNFGRR